MRLNKALAGLLRALVGHGGFLSGVRVALTVESLAEMLGVTVRTVRRAIALLRTLPELVRVLFIEREQTSYDGRPARVPHLEWELGPEAKTLLASLGAERPPPGHGALCHPDTVPPDQLLDQNSKAKFGLERSLEADAEFPDLLTAPPVECRPEPLPTEAVAPLEHAAEELETIVRQHLRIADPAHAERPVHPGELAVIDAALPALGALEPAERLAVCAEVSALAATDARSTGQTRATVRYAFRADWFALRVARLREKRERRQREQADAAMTRTLAPFLRPPVQAQPRPANAEQTRAHIEACLRALDSPPPSARAAGSSP